MNWLHSVKGKGKSVVGWFLSLALIFGGVLYLTLASHAASAQVVLPERRVEIAHQTVDRPVHISVSGVGIDLPVAMGAFDEATGQWNINDADAFFAQGTVTPIFYGHNQSDIFAPLAHVNETDRVTVTYQSGVSVQFIYDKTRFVAPTDASVLAENNPHTIILLTCSGLFNESRRLVYFKEIDG